MTMNDKMKAIPTKSVMGVDCWSPASAGKAVGVHRNTIIKWAHRTLAGALDMPLIRAPFKGSRIEIPVEAFLEWYSYAQN